MEGGVSPDEREMVLDFGRGKLVVASDSMSVKTSSDTARSSAANWHCPNMALCTASCQQLRLWEVVSGGNLVRYAVSADVPEDRLDLH